MWSLSEPSGVGRVLGESTEDAPVCAEAGVADAGGGDAPTTARLIPSGKLSRADGRRLDPRVRGGEAEDIMTEEERPTRVVGSDMRLLARTLNGGRPITGSGEESAETKSLEWEGEVALLPSSTAFPGHFHSKKLLSVSAR
jgi:hypothetical protein